jgi:hypothetical protein
MDSSTIIDFIKNNDLFEHDERTKDLKFDEKIQYQMKVEHDKNQQNIDEIIKLTDILQKSVEKRTEMEIEDLNKLIAKVDFFKERKQLTETDISELA